MSTTKYASAVAAVKAMEGTLLTRNDMEQLIGASGQSEFSALLTAKKVRPQMNQLKPYGA